MRAICIVLCLLLIAAPGLAATDEATTADFWQEFDITFWQTIPFATLWVYLADNQLSRIMYPGMAEPHWNAILIFSSIISVGNAWIYANEMTVDAK